MSPAAKQEAKQSEIAEYIEQAQRAQARRREAPRTGPTTRTEIEQKDLVAMYAPECLSPGTDKQGRPKPPKFHEFWANERDLKNLARQGYTPKVDDHGDLVTTSGGSVLTTLPWDLHLANLQGPMERAKHRLGEATSETARENPGIVSEEIGTQG